MANEYKDGDFANPTKVCDVIMKGGISSGVVYPPALTQLAMKFRFSQVGGISAGAIAASAAAAAEYGRHVPGGGFALLAKLPDEVGTILFKLFQPTRALKPVFDILVGASGNDSTATKLMRVIGAALAGFALAAAAGALPGLLIIVAGWWYAIPHWRCWSVMVWAARSRVCAVFMYCLPRGESCNVIVPSRGSLALGVRRFGASPANSSHSPGEL
jgi:hypothetical protein